LGGYIRQASLLRRNLKMVLQHSFEKEKGDGRSLVPAAAMSKIPYGYFAVARLRRNDKAVSVSRGGESGIKDFSYEAQSS
jgi:hypothetical protein